MSVWAAGTCLKNRTQIKNQFDKNQGLKKNDCKKNVFKWSIG